MLYSRLVGRNKTISRPNMLVIRVRGDLRMVRCIVVVENAFPLSNVCVSIVNAYRITQFGADHFVQIKE